MSGVRNSVSTTVWSLVLFATLAVFGATLYTVFVVAPVEKQMGIVQKIFYFHVPSAYAMYLGFAASAVGSAMYLLKRDPKWDALGVAGAEVGTLFCVIVLLTGPTSPCVLWAMQGRSRSDLQQVWRCLG
jgi:heme exporter protein C